MHQDRVNTIRDKLAEHDKDVYVAAHPENIYYLTGEYPVTGVFVITQEEMFFLVSRFSQYMVDAKAVYTKQDKNDVLQQYISGTVVSDTPRKLGDAVAVENVDWIMEMRAIKTLEELKQLRTAAAVTVQGMEKAADMLRTELSEKITPFDIAAEVEHFFKKQGCTNAFHTAGPGDNLVQVNAVTPHQELRHEHIKPGDVVIVDIGARNRLYCMDMSRTFCQDPSKKVKSMFDAVKKAQQAGLDMVEPGVEAAAVDQHARDVLDGEGWDPEKFFIHGLGHGVGINVHEKPRLAPGSDDELEAGNVVTVEPGVYVPKVGGVRIEDTIVIQEDGVEVLTESPKEL